MTDILKVVKGEPTPEELAALVTVIAARSSAAAVPATQPERPSNWATYWRNAGQPLRPGPGQWRASAHP